MFSIIVGRAVIAAVKGLMRPLAELEAALAIAAGEKRGEQRHAVRVDVYVTAEEFGAIAKNENIRDGMTRAYVAKDMGEFHVQPDP
jgi:hypothetical protein